jgi:hypothetical protein
MKYSFNIPLFHSIAKKKTPSYKPLTISHVSANIQTSKSDLTQGSTGNNKLAVGLNWCV